MFARKLQRYLALELLRAFLISTFFLLSLVLIGRGLQLSQTLINIGLTAQDAILLFIYMSPMFMLVVLPMSCMISIFLTFLRLNTDRELVALKSGGISLYQLLPAPMVFAAVCTALTLGVSIAGVPWGQANFRGTLLEVAQTRAKVNVQPGVFNQDIFGLTLFAKKVDPQTGLMHQVIFEDTKIGGKKGGVRTTFLAPEGSITTDENRGELVFNLKNGKIYRLDNNQLSVLSFSDYSIRLNLSELFSGGLKLEDLRPKEMSWEALRQIAGTEPGHEFYAKALIEIQKRMALPVACLVLGLFALPLACSFEGTKQQFGLLIAMLMFLVYYALFSFAMSLGETGKVPPGIGMWIPNLIFLILGFVGLHMAAHERGLQVTNLPGKTLRRLIRKKGATQ